MPPVYFKKWTNKKYAVLNSLHKVIHISTLSLACSILLVQPALAQSDTASPVLFYDLEEIETIGEDASDFYSPLLRQILIIRQEQLDLVSSRSFEELLDYNSSVDIRTRGPQGIQSDINIQGGSFDQSMILLNGINISDPQTGHFSLDIPLVLSQIQGLEILKGPATKKYGLNAYSGAVNIITMPKDSLSFNSDFSYGQYNTHKTSVTLNLPLGPIKNMLSFSRAGSDGYMQNTDYGSSNFYLHSAYKSKKLQSDFFLGWNNKAFGANAFYTPRFPEQYEETGSVLMALKFETRNSPALMSGNVFWRKHTDHFLLFRSNPSAYENYHMTDIIGVALGKKISSRTGISKLELRYRHEQIFSTSLGDELNEPVEIAGTNNSYYNRFKSRDHINLTADHYFQINKLYLNVGFLLQTLDAKFSEAGFYPGIDLSYKMNENFTFFGAANRTMRLPTFTDLYYVSPTNLGNPDLKPEKAQTFEIGTKYRNEILDGTFSLFYRNGKETIDWIWQDSVWQSMNITNLDAFGLETGVSLNPNWIRTSSKTIKHLNISYSYTELLKSSESYISNYALDNLRHKLVVDLGIQLPLNFYLDIKTSWQDRNGSYLYYSSPSSDPYEIQYDNHLLIDVNAGVKLHRLTLFIDVSNLLNTTYRDIGSVVMPGRWFMAGIKFR